MRNQYVPCHKYDTPFTAYLDEKVVGNGFQDENVGDIESSYGLTVRVGRHILTYHTDGTVDRQSFGTPSNAETWLDAIAKDYYLLDEES